MHLRRQTPHTHTMQKDTWNMCIVNIAITKRCLWMHFENNLNWVASFFRYDCHCFPFHWHRTRESCLARYSSNLWPKTKDSIRWRNISMYAIMRFENSWNRFCFGFCQALQIFHSKMWLAAWKWYAKFKTIFPSSSNSCILCVCG